MVCLIAKNTGRNGSTRCKRFAGLFVGVKLSENYARNPNLKGCQSLVVHRIDRITDNFCVNMFNAHYSNSQKGRLFILGFDKKDYRQNCKNDIQDDEKPTAFQRLECQTE